MQKQFKNLVENQFSFLQKSKVVIAISGGIDSVVLAHLCKLTNINFALAHCNFNLRGIESDRDEAFVTKLAESLNVEVFVQHFDTKAYSKLRKVSIQMAARELRYQWFQELVKELDFDFVLTAHHADDNLETFLINFIRGTGLNGLTGIPVINDNTIRPLLRFSRQEIESYAKSNHFKWCEDSSNSSRKYLRNKLRHDLVPILKEINPSLLDSFQDTLNYLNQTADIVEESLNAVAKRAITRIDNNGVYYKISEFKKVNNPKAYLHEMFKNYGFTAWEDILDLLDAQSGKFIKSSTHRLIKHRKHLILTDATINDYDSIFIEERDKQKETPFGQLIFEDSDKIGHNSSNCIYLDKEKLKFPLELRLWQPGDVFYPYGMQGKKKLSKYLKDEKYSLLDKENTWVLTSENRIVWVVGKRADERFKIESEAGQILKIELKP